MTDVVRAMHAVLASSADPASLAYQAVPVPDPGVGRTAGTGAGYCCDLGRATGRRRGPPSRATTCRGW